MKKITILTGKTYIAIRIGDACFGIGRPSDQLRRQAVRSRRHFGI